MTVTDAPTDVDTAPSTGHPRWAGFFLVAALLVLALSATAFNDARILAAGVFVTLLSVGLVFLDAELRRPPTRR